MKPFIIILFSLTLIQCEKIPDREDLLTLSWAKEKIEHPGGEGASEEKKIQALKSGKKLYQEGYRLYKRKKNKEAVKKYEDALKFMASGEIYYAYGNSLSNIGKLKLAVRAYQIAIKLGFKKKHFALYNIACAYSLLHDKNNAYKYLKKSVKQGYKSFGHMKRDGDLSYLRSFEDWKKRYRDILIYYQQINLLSPAGRKITETVASEENEYTFRTDGTASVFYTISEMKDHTKEGTWTLRNNSITIIWREEFGEKGVGAPVSCAASCTYADYKPFHRKIYEKQTLDWEEMKSDKSGRIKISDIIKE